MDVGSFAPFIFLEEVIKNEKFKLISCVPV
jgi:hypothetical protein